jgi:hypothetical protein
MWKILGLFSILVVSLVIFQYTHGAMIIRNSEGFDTGKTPAGTSKTKDITIYAPPPPTETTKQPPQQNCFNQSYKNTNCPQSIIETYTASLNTFNNANNTFIGCLEATNNQQYSSLLDKLKKIQSLVAQL